MTTGEFILEDYLSRTQTVQIYGSLSKNEEQKPTKKINRALTEIAWKIITRSVLVASGYVIFALMSKGILLSL